MLRCPGRLCPEGTGRATQTMFCPDSWIPGPLTTRQPTPGRSVRSGPAEAGRPVFLAQCRWHIRTEAALATNPMIGSLAGAVPAVHPEAWIAPGAVVIGSVRLGRAASVWYGAVLRADDDEIIVGPECNIQDLCCLHVDPGEPVVLEDRVSLGHHATVHGAHVGARRADRDRRRRAGRGQDRGGHPGRRRDGGAARPRVSRGRAGGRGTRPGGARADRRRPGGVRRHRGQLRGPRHPASRRRLAPGPGGGRSGC